MDQFKPELLCLSVSLAQQTPTAKKLIEQLRGEFKGRRPTIMLGGLALNYVENLWRSMGADVWSPDAKAALGEIS